VYFDLFCQENRTVPGGVVKKMRRLRRTKRRAKTKLAQKPEQAAYYGRTKSISQVLPKLPASAAYSTRLGVMLQGEAEIHLDDFDVSHTKDDILWMGEEEDEVEKKLLEKCGDYKERAQEHRKNDEDERGPSETETNVAIDELKKELTSPEMVDKIEFEDIPSPEIVESQAKTITEAIIGFDPTFTAAIGKLSVKGFLRPDLSPNDPYVTHDSAKANEVLIIVNQAHPHWKQLKGSDGVLNYLRHCTYDGIAEWMAKHKAAALTPNTIKYLKDKLLRVPFDIEMSPTSTSGG
jgi:hypothetical protein